MTIGPLEYVVIEFEGNHFTGEILPELHALRDQGVVRVVDLVFIQKDQDGKMTARELSDLSEDEAKPFGPIAGDMLRLLTPEDVEDVADSVPNNSSAAIALLEHTWAVHLQETIHDAHGKVLNAGLVPLAEVEALVAEMTAQQAAVSG
ncbi:MAG: DUF6325 family protein [Ktedonobacterales bacterium]